MPQYQNCIHWRVCAMPCPLDINDCRHFKPHEIHAHWIDHGLGENGNHLYECSNCKKGDIHADYIEVPYCWNCGAIMDEVVK